MSLSALSEDSRARLWRWALWLSAITVGYNLLEGLVATGFGFSDETLALFGFGLDSFIEVLSGLGVAHMIWRLQRLAPQQQNQAEYDRFERRALKITGSAFYLLVLALLATAALNLYTAHRPQDTFWGLVVSSLSIATMYLLMQKKLQVGHDLQSEPIIADAKCTRCCFYMSFILLASSGLYALTGFAHLDSLGALGIAWLAWREGQECFEKARARKASCCSGSGCG